MQILLISIFNALQLIGLPQKDRNIIDNLLQRDRVISISFL